MLTARKVQILIVCFMLLAPTLLWAADSIELLSKVEKVVIKTNEKGEKISVIESAKKILPGETVVYTNSYRNFGKEAASNIVINNPIPAHTNYVSASAFGEGADILFSADGGNTFAPAGKVLIKDEEGKDRLAHTDEYSNIRWTIKNELEPDATGEVGFWVRLQ